MHIFVNAHFNTNTDCQWYYITLKQTITSNCVTFNTKIFRSKVCRSENLDDRFNFGNLANGKKVPNENDATIFRIKNLNKYGQQFVKLKRCHLLNLVQIAKLIFLLSSFGSTVSQSMTCSHVDLRIQMNVYNVNVL